MDQANFYWTISAALISAVWVVLALFRGRREQALAMIGTLTTRLLEYDKLNIEHPQIQQYLSLNAGQTEAYFHDPQRLQEADFYQAKNLVYNQLNLFDEILGLAAKSRGSRNLLNPPQLPEKQDWEEYIRVKLRHPLYRSILTRESHIFGASLRAFWEAEQAVLRTQAPDPFLW